MLNLRFYYKSQEIVKKGERKSEEPESIEVTLVSDKKNIQKTIKFENLQKIYTQTVKLQEVVQPKVEFFEYSEVTPQDNTTELISPTIYRLDKLVTQLKKIGVNLNKAFNDENSKISIESNKDEFLMLPWEKLLDEGNTLPITRNVIASKIPLLDKDKNIAICLSHAYFDVDGTKMHKVADVFNVEVSSILSAMFDERKGIVNKPQKFSIFKYINEESIKQINFQGYNVVHLIMHGRENGDLGFEDENDHWKTKWIENNKLKDLFKSFSNNLMFISCCFSGSGDWERPSLAFQVVFHGVSSYSIGFNGAMGSEITLPSFTKDFYTQFFKNSDIEGAFNYAVKQLKISQNKYSNRPVLYKLTKL